MLGPFLCIVERTGDKHFAQFRNRTDIFGNRNEDIRSDQTQFGRIPAGEHFEPGQLAGFEIDLLFVKRHELPVRDTLADARLELVAKPQLGFHRLLEPEEAVLALLLGLIHRDVGLVHQTFGIAFASFLIGQVGAGGDTDRKRDIDCEARQLNRGRYAVDQQGCEMIDLAALPRLEGEQTGELVAAQPCDHRIGRQDCSDPRRDFLKDGVADRMAVEIVDLFEVVEVNRHRGERLRERCLFRDGNARRTGEAAPVERPGQMIDFGQPAHRLLGGAPCRQFGGKHLVAVPSHKDQGDVEDKGVGQRQIGRGGFAVPSQQEMRKNRTGRYREQHDCSKRDRKSKPVVDDPLFLRRRFGRGRAITCFQTFRQLSPRQFKLAQALCRTHLKSR